MNAEKIQVTGNKLEQKMYHRHSGYPGGLRTRTLREQLDRRPTEVLRKAVKGMLPRNRLARQSKAFLVGKAGMFDTQPFEDILAVVNVNFIGVLNGIHLAAPLLKATPNSLCFTTSSSSATFGMPGIAVYSATKHAVKGLTEALSIEFARYGVRVADTLPGLIDTPIVPAAIKETASSTGMFRLISPVEIAKAVWASYHDEPERLHWFVPSEIAELDKASALDPEGTRAMLAANAAFMPPPSETPR